LRVADVLWVVRLRMSCRPFCVPTERVYAVTPRPAVQLNICEAPMSLVLLAGESIVAFTMHEVAFKTTV
jgi:hypothetical protein